MELRGAFCLVSIMKFWIASERDTSVTCFHLLSTPFVSDSVGSESWMGIIVLGLPSTVRCFHRRACGYFEMTKERLTLDSGDLAGYQHSPICSIRNV